MEEGGFFLESGVLSERQLSALVRKGFSRDGPEPVVIRQSTVELHAGNVSWYCLRESHVRRVSFAEVDLLVRPGEIVSIVTQERVSLPNNVTGTIFPRGRLLALGMWSASTHVDYSFDGYLRIVFMNLGPNVIRLSEGVELARLELTYLATPGSGAHKGVNQDLKNVHHQSDHLVAESVRGISPDAMMERMATLQRRVEDLESASRAPKMGIRQRLSRYILAVCLVVAGGLLGAYHDPVLAFVNSQFGASLVGGVGVLAIGSVVSYFARQRSSSDEKAGGE